MYVVAAASVPAMPGLGAALLVVGFALGLVGPSVRRRR